MKPTELVIISGGQSGVDQAALDVAIARNIPYSGWCPRGGGATNFTKPLSLLSKYPTLRETPLEDVRQRTSWNVRDSHGTLLIAPEKSKGTDFAGECAEFIFQRPFHVVQNLAGEPDKALALATSWVTKLMETLAFNPFMLNVGGPRETEWPGIHDIAYSFLDKLMMALAQRKESGRSR